MSVPPSHDSKIYIYSAENFNHPVNISRIFFMQSIKLEQDEIKKKLEVASV